MVERSVESRRMARAASDGKEIAYQVNEGEKHSIRRRALHGHHPEETIYENDAQLFYLPIDWSPDRKYFRCM